MLTCTAIVPELVGAIHTFPFQGKRVLINLPAPVQAIDGRRLADTIKAGWHWIGEEDKPQEYHVNVVHVRIQVGQTMEVPNEVLQNPNTRWQVFDESMQQRLWNLLDE